MAIAVKVVQGGGTAAGTADFSTITRIYEPGELSGAMLDAGMQASSNGGACQWQFVVDDYEGTVRHGGTPGGLEAHNVVLVTEDAPGYDAWLGRGRISSVEVQGQDLWADRREMTATVDDANIDLKGLALTSPWVRGEESDVARVIAAIEAFAQGDPRHTTNISAGTAHLVTDGITRTMPAHVYPPGTDLIDIVADCASTGGKNFQVVIHHSGSASHLCLLYIDENDLDTFPAGLSITDDDPDLDTEFPPIWDQGAAVVMDGGEQPVSDMVVTYGPGTAQFVHEARGTAITDRYDYWARAHGDSSAETAAQASARADGLADANALPVMTHQITIKIPASKVDQLAAGQWINVRSARAFGGENLGQTVKRRIAQLKWEPIQPEVDAVDGAYLAHMQLDKPRKLHLERFSPVGPRPPAQPTDPVAGGTVRLYHTDYRAGSGDSTEALAAPALSATDADADWDDETASFGFYRMLYATPQSADDGSVAFDAVNMAVGDYAHRGYLIKLDNADLLAIIQGGGTFRGQNRANSRSGIGISEPAQDNVIETCGRIYRPGTGFVADLWAVGDATGDLKYAAQTTPVNRSFDGSFTAYASAVSTDYLAVDYGFHHAGPTSGGTGAGLRFNDTAASDLPEDQSTTANLRSWIEFTGTGSEGSPGDVPEPVGSEGAPGDEIGTFSPINHVHAHGLLSTSETRYHDDTHIEVTGTDGVNLGANVADALDLLASKLDGGTDGQVLTKQSGDDYDVDWETPSGGGGGGGGVTVLAPSSDTYINSQAATTNSDTETDLIIDNSWGTSSFTRFILMTFDISSLTGKNIGSAVLSLFRTNTGTSNATTVSVVKCLRAYVANQVTWNVYSTGNNWTTAGAGSGGNDRDTVFFGAGILRHGSSSEVQIDIARLLQRELDATETTLRIIIGAHFDPGDAVTFASLENATSAIRPQLRVVHD